MSILLAERDEHSRQELIDMLQAAGYDHIIACSSAADAWSRMQQLASAGSLAEIGLVLLDASSLQAALAQSLFPASDDLFYSDLPILIMGKVDSQDIVRMFPAHKMIDSIQKPINPSELQMRMRALYAARQYARQQKQYQSRLEALVQEHRNKLAIAKKVQRSVLSEPLHNENISISALYQPSKDLSGDMYCWYEIEPGRYGIMLLDVVGHGVSASLVSMSLRALLRGLIMRVTDPVKVMQELNRHIHHIFHNETGLWYFTAFYMVIDTNKQRIEYTNAGHPPAFLRGKDGNIRQLRKGCYPVGIIKEMCIEKDTLLYDRGTDILLYTDGLFTMFNSPLHAYRYIEEQMPLCAPLVLQELLMQHIQTEKTECSDDICIISIQL